HTVASCPGVSFTDVNKGTVVGCDYSGYDDDGACTGVILRTTDGGATWEWQSSGTTEPLSAVSFTDANTGTVVGARGTILRTTDGGATWKARPSGSTASTASSVSPSPTRTPVPWWDRPARFYGRR